MIALRDAAQIASLRRAGRALHLVTEVLRGKIKAGITTLELDKIAEELILAHGGTAAFKNYRGFPAAICTSFNEEVVHGIPSERRLKEGDLLKVDIGIKKEGFFADCAFTVALGDPDKQTKHLIEATRKALSLGIGQAKINNRLSDISWAIQNYIESQGFSVVRDFVGHGIGTAMHEAPEIPNFGRPHSGPVLKEGMVLAIEPMVNLGVWEVEIKENGWTAVTKDKLNSAHFEHTVAITAQGPEILTRL